VLLPFFFSLNRLTCSGYAFGKGVYFADMFQKSFAYCRMIDYSTPKARLSIPFPITVPHSLITMTTFSTTPDWFRSVVPSCLGRDE